MSVSVCAYMYLFAFLPGFHFSLNYSPSVTHLPNCLKVQPLRRLCLNSSETIAMDLVPNSVDDMYFGCTEQMLREVRNRYLKEEDEGAFQKAWSGAKTCAKKHVKNDDGLTKDHGMSNVF